METTWTHPKGGEMKTKTYQMLLTSNDSQMVINTKISAFGRWKGGTNYFCTNGVVYMIVGDGDFSGSVKFINNNASVDEASTKHFELATNKEYSEQFKKLEINTNETKPKIKSKGDKKKIR